MSLNQFQEVVNTTSEPPIIELPTAIVIIIVVSVYGFLIIVGLIIRQILLNHGACKDVDCNCCPTEGEPCCPCCIVCLQECCSCKGPQFDSCMDQCCPSRKNLDCGEIIMCKCCETDCCEGQPCCEFSMARAVRYPETYCECCVAMENRAAAPPTSRQQMMMRGTPGSSGGGLMSPYPGGGSVPASQLSHHHPSGVVQGQPGPGGATSPRQGTSPLGTMMGAPPPTLASTMGAPPSSLFSTQSSSARRQSTLRP